MTGWAADGALARACILTSGWPSACCHTAGNSCRKPAVKGCTSAPRRSMMAVSTWNTCVPAACPALPQGLPACLGACGTSPQVSRQPGSSRALQEQQGAAGAAAAAAGATGAELRAGRASGGLCRRNASRLACLQLGVVVAAGLQLLGQALQAGPHKPQEGFFSELPVVYEGLRSQQRSPSGLDAGGRQACRACPQCGLWLTVTRT